MKKQIWLFSGAALLASLATSPLPAQTLVDYYEFENNGIDSAGGDANGAVGANVTFTTGAMGQGAQFGTNGSGTANRIDVPQANAFDPGAGSFTIAFWAQRDDTSTGSTDGIFDALSGTTTGYQALFTDTGIARLRLDDVPNNDLIDTATAITDSAPHYYAFVIDRTNDQARVYLDGMLDNVVMGLNATGALTPSQDLQIGSINSASNAGMEGVLDELRFYTGVLSDEQIAILAGVPEPASIAIWSLLAVIVTGLSYHRLRRES